MYNHVICLYVVIAITTAAAPGRRLLLIGQQLSLSLYICIYT